MNCGDSIRVVHPLFQTEGGGSTPTSPLQFHIGVISEQLAIALNKLWHSRLPNIDALALKSEIGRQICFGAEFGNQWYATAIWTAPMARMLNGKGWLELRRFAIAPDAPRNTASRMLRVMIIKIRQTNPGIVKLISYQDTEVHTGTIYRASGWRAGNLSAGGEWSRPSRKRNAAQSTARKIRWEFSTVTPPSAP